MKDKKYSIPNRGKLTFRKARTGYQVLDENEKVLARGNYEVCANYIKREIAKASKILLSERVW